MKSIINKIYSFFSFNEEKSNLPFTDKFLLLGCLFIIIIGIYTVYDIQKYADILFWDESLYMQKGLQLWQQPSLDWGPFYNIWYKLLSYFTSDKIELYYLNIKVLSVLLPLLLFIFLMVNNINPMLSFFVSILFLYSYINLPIWPKVSHWCLIVFLIALIISKRFINSVYLKFLTIILGMIVCSYIRPEFYLAFILFSCFTIIHLFIYRHQYPIKSIALYLSGILGLFILVKLVGNPTKTGGNGRMLITFGQHFALNYSRWNNITDKPFWIDWVFYLQDNFIHKPTNVILSTIGHHILSNIGNYIKSISKIIISFILPIFQLKLTIHSIILVGITILILVKNSAIQQFKKSTILSAFHPNNDLLKILFIWCIPTLASSIIAYPRDHYLILQIPLYLILTVVFIDSILKLELNLKLFTLIAIVLFFAKPSAANFDYFDLLRKEKSLSNVTTVKYLQKKYPTKIVKVFDFEGDINTMLPKNFTSNSIDFFKSGSTVVSKYIDSAKIDIIYVTPSLLHSRFTQNDTLLKAWISSPEKYAFQKVKTGNFVPYLLSRIK